jgi:hypothetical protein
MCEGHVYMIIKILFIIYVDVLDISILFQKSIVLDCGLYQMIEVRFQVLKITLWSGSLTFW